MLLGAVLLQDRGVGCESVAPTMGRSCDTESEAMGLAQAAECMPGATRHAVRLESVTAKTAQGHQKLVLGGIWSILEAAPWVGPGW